MRPVLMSTAVVLSGMAAIGIVPGAAHAAVAGGGDAGGTVTVGVGDGGSSAGGPGGTSDGGGVNGGGTGVGSGGTGWVCTYVKLVLNDGGGIAPGGPTPGSWYSVTCTNQVTGSSVTQTEWIPDQAPTSAPVVDPFSVALQAERSMVLPRPTVHSNPSGTAVVNLLTWLWIDPGTWHPYSVTASVGSVSANAVAIPEMVTWSMGDGDTVSCAGPGTPFDMGRPESSQVTGCEYSYPITSAGQPASDGIPDHGSFTVQATVTWSVTWSAQGASGGGALPSLTTSAAAPLRVEQVQSVNSDLAAAPAPTSRPQETAR